MKKYDERNLNELLKVFDVGERLSARQALDRLIDRRILTGGSMNYIPHVNRLAVTMKVSGRFIATQAVIDGAGDRTLYERAF